MAPASRDTQGSRHPRWSCHTPSPVELCPGGEVPLVEAPVRQHPFHRGLSRAALSSETQAPATWGLSSKLLGTGDTTYFPALAGRSCFLQLLIPELLPSSFFLCCFLFLFQFLMSVKAVLYIKAPLFEIHSVISVSDWSPADTSSNTFST